MAVSSQVVLAEMQRVTLEGAGDLGASWPSGMWTLAEVLGYLNQRQNRWLAATGLLWTQTVLAVTPNVSRQDAPTDWAATVFLAYCNANGCYRELQKVDTLELDLGRVTWPNTSSDRPVGYYETDGETRSAYIVPIPSAFITNLEWYYVALGTPLTQTPAVNLVVPEEFVPTIKYGALAEMFSKVGPAANPVLAQACEQRWQEGVEMGTLMAQEGWFCL